MPLSRLQKKYRNKGRGKLLTKKREAKTKDNEVDISSSPSPISPFFTLMQ